jgi:transcriptional regulator with XRE-family HTH domain
MTDIVKRTFRARFGDRLRRCRKKRGLTQDQLARKLGNPTTGVSISSWETGRYIPQLENLRRLADALEVKVDRLLPRE